MRKIVLLGSSGFIGKNIVEYFKKQERKVVGFDSKTCDLLDFNLVDRKLDFLSSEDTLVVTSSITRLVENSIESMNKNILMIQNLIDKLATKKVKQLIFFSSIDVYGIKNTPYLIDESTALNPDDYYATSKVISEYLLKLFCSKYGVKLTILRLSGVYGRYDYGKSTVAKIVTNIYNNKLATIVGDSSLKRDFLYIDDLLKVLEQIIKSETEGIFNLATGSSISIEELIEKVFFILDIPKNIEYKKVDTQEQFIRAGDLSFDNSLLRQKVDRFAFTDIDTNLREYIQLFRSHYEKQRV